MFSRYDRLNTVNDLVSGAGYELNPERGWFSVIVPEATTNLITNPRLLSPLGALTGYTALAGSIAATGNWQAIGSYGLAMTPAASTESGAYYGTISLTAGVTYTASVVLQGEAGKLYYIYFATTAGAVLGTKRAWRATGYKQRIWVTYPETSTTTRRVYVTRASSYADTNVFYSGSWQVEAKSYPTSYCDGNMQGFLPGEVAYWWNGIPDGSTSTRSSQTRSGGKEVNLLDYGLRILAIVGLGMAPLIDQALTLPGLGEYPIGTGTMARTFTLAGQMEASGPRHMQALHSGLINLFKPDAVSVDQPMILRYQAFDGEDAIGESVDIVAKYRGGLEGNYVNHNQEPVSLTFKQYIPQLQNTYDNGTSIGTYTFLGFANGLIAQDPTTGSWNRFGAAMGSFVYDSIFDARTGRVYVAQDVSVEYYDGGVVTLNSANDIVSAVAVDAAGNIYAGGEFTLYNAVANTAYIAKYTGAVWTALGTGMNGNVLVLTMAPDGKLYVGGAFTTGNGVALNGIGYWNGATFVAMGSGAAGGNVAAIVVDPNGRVYAAGSFTSMGGVANTKYIAYWEAGAWHSLSVFEPDDEIRALALGPDGTLYAGGDFLNVTSGLGSIGAHRIMKWTGTIWQEIGNGVDNSVYDIQFGPDGNLYACGTFLTAGSTALYSAVALWNGWSWVPLNFNMATAYVFTTMAFDKQGSLYIGGTFALRSLYVSVTTVTVNGDSKTYPKFIITGPGKIFQAKNWVNGKILQFYNLTLADGEVAVLDLNPLNLSFVSNTRGNLLPYIQSGTDLNWFLLPGTNYITSLMYDGVTASSSVVLSWRNQYWSMDGAINK